MSAYGKKHYNIVISLQLIKINGKKKVNDIAIDHHPVKKLDSEAKVKVIVSNPRSTICLV